MARKKDFCPARREWWNPEIFRPFYLIDTSHDPEIIITPAEPIEDIKDENGNVFALYLDKTWIDAGIKVHWAKGPMADEKLEKLVEWDHWHTSFHIRSHLIHIDFVSFLCMGPRTAYREYRVFNDNQEICRGGGFAGFLGGNFKIQRNWPLSIEIEDHLIYFQKPLQVWYGGPTKGEIREENTCSIWVKLPPTDSLMGRHQKERDIQLRENLMPAILNNLGFDVHPEQRLHALNYLAFLNGTPYFVPDGSYRRLDIGSGIELWGQTYPLSQLRGINVHYRSSTTQVVGLTRKFTAPHNPFDGSFEAWINPEFELTDGNPDFYGDYPLIFNTPCFRWYENLKLPVLAEIQLAAYARWVDFHDDDQSGIPIPGIDDIVLSPNYFIPTGTFKEADDELPAPEVEFGGTILQSSLLTNKGYKKQFYKVTVQTYSMEIDLLIAPELITQPLEPGKVLVGSYWLTGVINALIEPMDAENVSHRNKFLFECQIAGLNNLPAAKAVSHSFQFGDRLVLMRERDNIHDEKAIAVYSENGVQLGYIPASMNKILAEQMDLGVQPTAYISEKRGKQTYSNLVMRVYLPSGSH